MAIAEIFRMSQELCIIGLILVASGASQIVLVEEGEYLISSDARDACSALLFPNEREGFCPNSWSEILLKNA